MIHGLDRRRTTLTASPTQALKVVYRDQARRERSAGIYGTEPAARAVKRRVERGDFDENVTVTPQEAASQQKALILFGDYVTITWWPRWRDAHPHSAYLYPSTTAPRRARADCQ